jgi:predicted restriction endonuclease
MVDNLDNKSRETICSTQLKARNNIASKKYYSAHKEERIAYARSYQAIHQDDIKNRRAIRNKENAKEISLKDKEYRLAHKEELRAYNMMRYHGVTIQEIEELKLKQNNKCAICGNELKSGKGTHLDHDHASGINRGLLCSSCNLGIGSLKDNPEIVLSAYKYLELWGEICAKRG